MVLRHIDQIYHHHARRRSEFDVPSAIYLGHALTVRRLDENQRGVSQQDLSFLMNAEVAPGTTQTLRNHSGKPPNRFVVYMSSTPSLVGNRPPTPSGGPNIQRRRL